MTRRTAIALAAATLAVSTTTAQAKRGPAPLPDEVFDTGSHGCNVTVFPGMKISGSFAHDRGCIFAGMTIAGKGVTGGEAATAVGLPKLGWKRASRVRRRQLAIAWTRRVLSRLDDFRIATGGDFPGFSEPRAISAEDGSVAVTLWMNTTPRSMRPPKWRTYVERTVTFDRDGRLVGTRRGRDHREPFFKK